MSDRITPDEEEEVIATLSSLRASLVAQKALGKSCVYSHGFTQPFLPET